MNKKNKVKVKINVLLNNTAVKDTVSGIQFNKDEWVEIDSDIWDRLKDNVYNQGGTRVKVLISDDEPEEIESVEDNEAVVEDVEEDFFITEEE